MLSCGCYDGMEKGTVGSRNAAVCREWDDVETSTILGMWDGRRMTVVGPSLMSTVICHCAAF